MDSVRPADRKQSVDTSSLLTRGAETATRLTAPVDAPAEWRLPPVISTASPPELTCLHSACS